MDRSLRMDKTVDICPVYSHYSMILAEQDFNIQVDDDSPCGSQSMSSATTSVIMQWAHKQSGHAAREEGYTWAQQRRLLSINVDLATASSENPLC